MDSVPDIPTADDSRPTCERCRRATQWISDVRLSSDLCDRFSEASLEECDRLLLARAQRAENEVTRRAIELGVVKSDRRALREAGGALAAVAHLFLDGKCDQDALRRGVEAWRTLPPGVR